MSISTYKVIADRVEQAGKLYGLDRIAISDCQRRACQYYESGNPYEEAISFGAYLAKWRHNWNVLRDQEAL